MRRLSVIVVGGLLLLLAVSLRFEATQVTVMKREGYEAATSFESRLGCVTTLVQVALNNQEEKRQPSGATVVRQNWGITLTQFSDPKNGKDPTTGQDCPALALQEISATLEPADGASLEIASALEKAKFTGQARLKDQQGNNQLLLFEVMWEATSPPKAGYRVNTYQEDKTTIYTVYSAKTRLAVARGFMGHCDGNQDGVCSAEEKRTTVNYLTLPAQGEATFIRWYKIRTVLQNE